jgi:site-specific recombinase XerD/ribosomal protein S27AE
LGIYRYERRIWLAIEGKEGIKKSKEILPENKKKLLEYAEYLKAAKKSLPRQDKLIRTLKTFATLLRNIPSKSAVKEDIVHVLATVEDHWKIELSHKGRPGPASDYTRRDFQEIVKQFYAWLFDVEDPRHEGYPKPVSWIHSKAPKSKLNASDLLAPADVKQLIGATPDLRLKALIDVCYECGLRVGEALQMHIKDVNLQEQYAELSVSGKTGPRVAYSIESLPLLVQWLDQHPDRKNTDAWLWTDDTEPLSYDKARFKLQECRRKAKVPKRVFWHLFRHSSATRNAGLGEPMLRSIYGWSKNSDEPSTYVHLSGETVRNALLKKKGVQQKSAQEPLVTMCPRCGSPNQPDASLCGKCKSVLKLEHAVSMSTVQKKLEEQNKTIEKMQGQIDMMSRFMNKVLDEDDERDVEPDAEDDEEEDLETSAAQK